MLPVSENLPAYTSVLKIQHLYSRIALLNIVRIESNRFVKLSKYLRTRYDRRRVATRTV